MKRVLVVQVCEECGAEFPIWRKASKLKTNEHIKHMYCPNCKRVTAHKQRRESMRINVILMDGAPTPRHAKAGDAGLDLTTRQTVEIGPHETVKVKTGVRMEIPQGYYGLVAPRSSVAANRGITLANTPSIIDSGFRGEILLPLHNLCSYPVKVERGERVAQIIIMRYETCECVAVSELSETERGDGGFGSTGA